MELKTIAVFSSVVFTTSSNRSVQNVVEGLLKRNCRVLFYTIHPFRSEYMERFVSHNPNFQLIYVTEPVDMAVGAQAGSASKTVKERVKELFKYRNFQSNTETLEWLGLPGTFRIIMKFAALLKREESKLLCCDAFLFIDKFGGMLSQYLRLRYRSFWKRIEARTAGYYLGTVLKQFGSNWLKAFLLMPINFLGSYKVPMRRLIVTDDGTDGENVFRNVMDYAGEVLFIRNGLDQKLTDFTPRTRKPDSAKLSFVTCSRLTPWKRIDRAIRFLKCLCEQGGVDARLTVVGEGEERDRLVQLARELKVEDRVLFTGPLYYDDVLQTLDCHEFCIVFNDLSGLGNQIYESIHLGLIPLVIDDGSTDSLLTDKLNAFKFRMSPSFEADAAAIFLERYSSGHHEFLSENLVATRKLLFSWDQRNEKQYEFIFGSRSE